MTQFANSELNIVRAQLDERRLLATAMALIEVPSPTRSAGPAADRMAAILEEAGFRVERPVADWPDAPAVVARYDSGQPGPVLQFDGHLDTVHLPFVPPRVAAGNLYGSGASDMKGGIAAFIEATRVLAASGLLKAGSILITAHDHHEGPWGDKRQLLALIREGYTGDAVMLPEYLAGPLPLAGRGSAIFEVTLKRAGEPVHEVLAAPGTPNVVAAGAELARRLFALDDAIRTVSAPYAGHDSAFVGSLHAGEIYNQYPVKCTLAGTRRWVMPGMTAAVVGELRQLFDAVAEQYGLTVEVTLDAAGDAFRLDPELPAIQAFQAAYAEVTGAPLQFGGKPFVDDGNLFAAAGIPAITHGPAATGAHTVNECAPVSELVRVAQVYALTALAFCNPS